MPLRCALIVAGRLPHGATRMKPTQLRVGFFCIMRPVLEGGLYGAACSSGPSRSGNLQRIPKTDTHNRHRQWTPTVDTHGGHPQWTPTVDTHNGHPRWTPTMDTHGGHPQRERWASRT